MLDHESFNIMAIYLLFSATYNQVPLASIIDTKIKENLEKAGSAKNAAFWNWTPKQKSLLDADIPRVIMTSHWSTGKTRILFEKALRLARDGKIVILVLHYSQFSEEQLENGERSIEHTLILLCHSLRNAIGKENDDVQKKINLIVSNNLREDLLNIDKLQSDANIFVDEFSVHTDKDLDDIAAKLDKENHIWITVAKASRETNKTFRTWLAKKLTEGYLEPSLKFPLRNSKEIVEFENSLAPKLDGSLTDTAMNYEILDDAQKQENLMDADTPKIESNVESKELLISEVTQNITLVQLFDMATQNWPRTELTLPKNMFSGQQIHIDHHDKKEPLEDAMARCFDKLHTS